MEFKFPDVGEGITQGEIVSVKVKLGDKVKVDQILFEVETDKAVVEIPSPAAGKIDKIYFQRGEVVEVGQVLVDIDDGKSATKTKSVPKKANKSGVVGSIPEEEIIIQPTKKTQSTKNIKKKQDSKTSDVLALPAVRKYAKDNNIDLTSVIGSGKNGRILMSDLENKSKSENKKSGVVIKEKEYDYYGFKETVPLSGIRKTIASRMLESQEKTASLTHFDECDITDLVRIRAKEKQVLSKKDIKLTFMPYVIKALIITFKQFPKFNAEMMDESLVLKYYYNFGIAVDTPDGLLVPVLKKAEKKSMEEIAKELDELGQKARERKLTPAEMKFGTFTISNVGSIGGIFATPIINYPQTSILLLGRMQKKPMIVDDGKGGNKTEVRYMLPLSLTFDHRVIDGAEAAKFMNLLKEYLNDPDHLMLEM